MKPLLLSGFFGLLFAVSASAQGYSLQFNRVIDTSLGVSLSVCTDLTSNGVSSNSITVPAGKTWKIESIGPLDCVGLTYLYNNCGGSSSSNQTTWGLYMDDGTRSVLKKYFYQFSGTFGEQSAPCPVWLREGTQVYTNISSRSTTYRFADQAVFSVRTSLSIIEFNIISAP